MFLAPASARRRIASLAHVSDSTACAQVVWCSVGGIWASWATRGPRSTKQLRWTLQDLIHSHPKVYVQGGVNAHELKLIAPRPKKIKLFVHQSQLSRSSTCSNHRSSRKGQATPSPVVAQKSGFRTCLSYPRRGDAGHGLGYGKTVGSEVDHPTVIVTKIALGGSRGTGGFGASRGINYSRRGSFLEKITSRQTKFPDR